MAVVEVDRQHSVTSSGSTPRIDGLTVREWTVYAETAAGSTATFQLQTARDVNSSTPAIPYGTVQNLGASSGVCLQFTGPSILFARVSDATSTGTVTFRFIGN